MTTTPRQGPRRGRHHAGGPLRRSILAGTGPRGRASTLLGVLGVSLLVVAWWLGSLTTAFVPPVGAVLAELPRFLLDPETLDDVAVTWVRVVVSLLLATASGFLLALVMVRSRHFGPLVERVVTTLLGVPSTILALLALFVFRRDPIGVYLVVILITLPFIAIIFVSGLRDIQARLEEMATVYDIRGTLRLRHVVVPQLVPYAFAALRNEHGHAWKVAVLAEVFAVGHGMGASFSRAFDRFILPELMLWLLAFIIVLLATEYVVLRPLERFALRWRRS